MPEETGHAFAHRQSEIRGNADERRLQPALHLVFDFKSFRHLWGCAIRFLPSGRFFDLITNGRESQIALRSQSILASQTI